MANADLEKYYKALDRYLLFFQFCFLFGLYFCLFGFFLFRLVRQFICYGFDFLRSAVLSLPRPSL